MFGSVMLDVAIGLILVYLILSLVCTALREAIEGWLKNRSTFLHRGVCELLHDESLTKDLYEHPLISSLYKGTYAEAKAAHDLPSYIPSGNFALALLDMTARGRDTSQAATAGSGSTVLSMASLRQNIARIQSPKVQRVLLSAIDLSGGELAKVQTAIETWFNSSMDRVSGWYKRRSQVILIWAGLGIAAAANIDTMRLALSFYRDPAERQALVAMAGSVTKSPPTGTSAAATPDSVNAAEVGQLLVRLDSLQLPIGWPDTGYKNSNWIAWGLLKVFGWILTGLAISLGAPFWFDLLSKIMTVRSTLKPGSNGSSPSAASNGAPGETSVTVVNAPSANGAAASAGVTSSNGVPPGDDYRPHEWSSGHPHAGAM